MVKVSFIDLLTIVAFLVVFYLILTRIFGHSATDMQLMVGVFTALMIYLAKLDREIGESKIDTKHRFGNIESNMNIFKDELAKVHKSLEAINNKLDG